MNVVLWTYCDYAFKQNFRFELLFITTHADDNINKPVWIWLGQYFDMCQGKTHVNHYWNMGYSLQAEGKMQIASIIYNTGRVRLQACEEGDS